MADIVYVNSEAAKQNKFVYFVNQQEMDMMIRMACVAPALDSDTYKPLGTTVITAEHIEILNRLKEGTLYTVLLVDEDEVKQKNEKGQLLAIQMDGSQLKQAIARTLMHSCHSSDTTFTAYLNRISHGTNVGAETEEEERKDSAIAMATAQILTGYAGFCRLEHNGEAHIINGPQKPQVQQAVVPEVLVVPKAQQPTAPVKPVIPIAPTIPGLPPEVIKQLMNIPAAPTGAVTPPKSISQEEDMKLVASLFNPAKNKAPESQNTPLSKPVDEQGKPAGRKGAVVG